MANVQKSEEYRGAIFVFSIYLKSPLPAIILSIGVAECSAEAAMLKQGSISSRNSSLEYENLRKHHEV